MLMDNCKIRIGIILCSLNSTVVEPQFQTRGQTRGQCYIVSIFIMFSCSQIQGLQIITYSNRATGTILTICNDPLAQSGGQL